MSVYILYSHFVLNKCKIILPSHKEKETLTKPKLKSK